MSSPLATANGNSGGTGGQLGGQGGARGHGGGDDEVMAETMYHYAIAADFDVSEWSKKGKTPPTCDARMKDIANVLTKYCPGTQLAPLPYIPGGENLPLVGRADKTADDIYSIPTDQWSKYAIHTETIKQERSTGRCIHKGVFGLKSNLTLKEIKERTEVSAVLRQKGRPVYLKVHNCASCVTTRIGVLYNIHANLVLHDELAKEITRVCGLRTDEHGRMEIEVSSKRTTFGRGQSTYQHPSYQQMIHMTNTNAMMSPQQIPLPGTPQRPAGAEDEAKRKADLSLSAQKQRGSKNSKSDPNG